MVLNVLPFLFVLTIVNSNGKIFSSQRPSLYLRVIEISVSRNNLVDTLAVLGKEYKVSLELSVSSYSGSGLSNILHFSNDGPQVFVNHNSGDKIREVDSLLL